MTLPSSVSNNGHSQQPNAHPNAVEEVEFQNESRLSYAELTEIWAKRAYNLAQEPPAEVTGQTTDLLVFWLNGEQYALEVTSVQEIYPLEQVTPVPRTPNFVVGVFSARGRILSIIDLPAFFGLPTLSLSSQTKIIVVTTTSLTTTSTQMEVGILADEVDDVITIFKDDLKSSLTIDSGVRAEYLQGLTTDMMVVLDLETLLNDDRLIVYEEIL